MNHTPQSINQIITYESKIILTIVAALLLPIAALGQNYSATFRGNNLRSTLEVLTEATGYDFVYKTGLVGTIDRTVTGEYTDIPLDRLLDLTLTDQLGLSYKIVDKTISLFEDVFLSIYPGGLP